MSEIIKNIFPILIIPLLTTIIVEEIVLLVFREKQIKMYVACLIVNIVTNLSLNIILQLSSNYYLMLIILEITVVIIEGIVYYLIKKDWKMAIILALVCNIMSFVVGMFI